MGEAQYRGTYDQRFCFNVTAPGNGSAAGQIFSLLTGAQQAEISGYQIMQAQITPVATAINYFHCTPNNVAPFVLSPNSGGIGVNAGQKPNEFISVQQADKKIFLQSTTAGTVVVQLVLDGVSKDNL